MNARNISVLILSLLLISTVAFTSKEKPHAKDEIIEVVESAYINGAFNQLNTEAMAKGFHSEFAIFSASGEEIKRYPIADWIDSIEKRKAKDDFNPDDHVWDHKLPQLDITGGAASVKVELFKDGKHVYTDYLSLLKFDSGWKIVAKVYHKHTDS